MTFPIVAALALALLLAWATVAFASSNGGSGVGAAPPPQVLNSTCLARVRPGCIDPHWASAGSTIRLSGRNLATVATVVFYGRGGPADDVTAPAVQHRSTSVTTRVPQSAHNGPLAVVTTGGTRSHRWNGLVIDEPAKPPPPKPTGLQPSIGTIVSTPRKVFYGGLQKPVFSFQVGGDRPVDVTVRLIRVKDQAIVRTWIVPQVQPGVGQKIVWDGTAGGKVQSEGYYSFQAGSGGATGASASPSADDSDSFAFYGNMFPIRGKHEYSMGAGRFGASRQGHTHQGQDVLASCGTPLVAARAGKVSYRGYHSLAGYYVVISGDGAGQDYVYMHLRAPALVKAGQHVYTGQPIGEVGQTGDAHGCHLHLELWSAPGWYKGGRPFDPLPQLKRWDLVS